MEIQPLFSILIANYNNGKYISECLESVLAQDYEHIEVIIVDDASTDNSLTILQPYLAKNNFKLFVNEENKGVGFTKKRCIDKAGGEICGFLDPDDTLTPDAVSKMIKAHQENPQASLIYSNLYFCDINLKITALKEIKQVPQKQKDFFNDKGHIAAFATFKKKIYLETEGINPKLLNAEDQDLYLKLYDTGDCILLDERLYFYRRHHKGLSTFQNEDLAYFWRWKVILERAEKYNIPIEQKFLNTFVRRVRVERYLKIDNLIRQSFIYPILKWLKR